MAGVLFSFQVWNSGLKGKDFRRTNMKRTDNDQKLVWFKVINKSNTVSCSEITLVVVWAESITIILHTSFDYS